MLFIYCFMYFPLSVGVLSLSLVLLSITCVHSSFAINLKRNRELVAFLLLSYWCIVTINVLWLFLAVRGLVCSMWLLYFLIMHTFCSYITQFLRSRRLIKMAIYQPLAMPLVMPQPWFWTDSTHIRVLLSGSLSGNGKISCLQAFRHARNSIQEALCYLNRVSLKSSVTDALEEYV